MLGYLFDLPSASSSLATMGEWSKPVFSDMIPLAFLLMGITFVLWVISQVINSFKR